MASIDIDGSGFITFPEFYQEFLNMTEKTIEQIIQENRDKVRARQAMDRRRKTSKYNLDESVMGFEDSIGGGMGPDIQLQTKIAIIEAREKQSTKKYELAMRRLKGAEIT
jgi:hypothetical protein